MSREVNKNLNLMGKITLDGVAERSAVSSSMSPTCAAYEKHASTPSSGRFAFHSYRYGFLLKIIIKCFYFCNIILFSALLSFDVYADRQSFCDDPYKTICKNESSGSKKKSALNFEALIDAKDKEVLRLENVSAQSMGYKNREEYLEKRLKENGFGAEQKLGSEVLERLLSETDGIEILQYKEVSPLVSYCEEVSKPDFVRNLKVESEEQLRARIQTMVEKKKTMESQSRRYWSQDLVSYLNVAFAIQCQAVESSNLYEKNFSRTLKNQCMKQKDINRSAARILGTSEEQVLARKEFLETYLKLPILDGQNPQFSYGYKGKSAAGKAAFSEASQLTEETKLSCSILVRGAEKALIQTLNDAKRALHRQKPFVEGVIDYIYNNRFAQSMQQQMKEIQSDFDQLIEAANFPEQVKSQWKQQVSRLQFFKMEKPGDELYEKIGPRMQLKAPTLADQSKELYQAQATVLFSDPHLQELDVVNANYTPLLRMSDFESPPRVYLTPLMSLMGAKDPLSVQFTVMHEMAHSIGSFPLELLKQNTSDSYKKIFECFAGKDSIGMLEVQKDEVSSDYWASELLALQMKRLKPIEQFPALKKQLLLICDFESNHSELSIDEHPSAELRISGIIGSNSNLRQALGCKKPLKDFKSCGFEFDAKVLNRSPRPQSSSSPTGLDTTGAK